MDDSISRQAAIDEISSMFAPTPTQKDMVEDCLEIIENLPSAKPGYEPVKAEDFARTMSKNTIYSFMAWHDEALELMERQGFVICKKTL